VTEAIAPVAILFSIVFLCWYGGRS